MWVSDYDFKARPSIPQSGHGVCYLFVICLLICLYLTTHALLSGSKCLAAPRLYQSRISHWLDLGLLVYIILRVTLVCRYQKSTSVWYRSKARNKPMYDLCYSPLAGWSYGLLSLPYYRKWRCHDTQTLLLYSPGSPDQCLGGRNSLTLVHNKV